VISPPDWLVKVTVRGTLPESGEAVKSKPGREVDPDPVYLHQLGLLSQYPRFHSADEPTD